jgi:hypothetical protein
MKSHFPKSAEPKWQRSNFTDEKGQNAKYSGHILKKVTGAPALLNSQNSMSHQ